MGGQGEKEDTTSTDTNLDTPISCFWCRKESCRRLRSSFNSYWRLAAMGAGVIIYLFIGGAIFTAVERPSELRRIEESAAARNAAIADFTNLLLNSTNLTEEEAADFTTAFLELGQVAAEATETLAFDTNPIWDFASAVFFCSTVITTIGYGTIFPSTAGGQILFMFYAILGIPLALIFLTMIGNIIDAWVARALRPVERRWGPLVSRAVGSLALIFTVLVFFMLIPAIIFSDIESWSYRESVYFTVVTLTTVGFGDFVPAGASSSVGDDEVSGLYKLISAVWLWIGLALVAALISQIQDVIKSAAEWLRAHHCCGGGGGRGGQGSKDGMEVEREELREVGGGEASPPPKSPTSLEAGSPVGDGGEEEGGEEEEEEEGGSPVTTSAQPEA